LKMKNLYFIIYLVLLTISNASAQIWDVPEEQKAELSQIKFDNNTAKQGQEIFMAKCTSCHGLPTKANFLSIVPTPGDPASKKFQDQLDGELFYKISNGRGAMPQFSSALTESEIWSVVSYFRTFNANYTQPEIPKSQSFAGSEVYLDLNTSNEGKKIILSVTGNEQGKIIAAKGVDVKLLVKRNFGLLPIEEKKKTNAKGEASFTFPLNLPGDDDEGNLTLIAQIVSSQYKGETEKQYTLKLGLPKEDEKIWEERSLWGTRENAPLWLILTFTLTVVGIWFIIGYIVYQIYRIKKSSTL